MAYVYPKARRQTRDLLRRRSFFVRQRAQLIAHIVNTNSQFNLPPLSKKLSYAANRSDGIAERFEHPSTKLAISADLAPGSVELRMSGSDPEFVVSTPSRGTEPTLLLPPPDDEQAAEIDPDEEPVARISLRLPASVKAKVDRMADREQISTNAWLLRAVMDALGERRARPDGWPAPPGAPEPPGPPIFGVHGPFGPHGVFGANGPFGPDGLFGSHPRPEQPEHRHPRGNVQGWVR